MDSSRPSSSYANVAAMDKLPDKNSAVIIDSFAKATLGDFLSVLAEQVDNEILNILRQRFEDCVMYETPDHVEKCTVLMDQYTKATENWFIKYGDLGAYGDVKDALMKQKHRLIWERRHGPVGSGMKETSATA